MLYNRGLDVNDLALRFRCTACGECCRTYRVPVTDRDLQRLSSATGRPAAELTQWLTPDEVDLSGEPFVELGSGRRLLVLAHAPSGGCELLGDDGRCSFYESRPADCRAFPFDFSSDPDKRVRRLELLPLDACPYERDGANDIAELVRIDEQRWQELREFQARVQRWNQLARHRRRLRKPVGGSAEFLAFLGLR